MKLTVAAVILFTSVTTSFAGNFTPIPKKSRTIQLFYYLSDYVSALPCGLQECLCIHQRHQTARQPQL
jgi:hypothetical protein